MRLTDVIKPLDWKQIYWTEVLGNTFVLIKSAMRKRCVPRGCSFRRGALGFPPTRNTGIDLAG
jgi:hypothetical protein